MHSVSVPFRFAPCIHDKSKMSVLSPRVVLPALLALALAHMDGGVGVGAGVSVNIVPNMRQGERMDKRQQEFDGRQIKGMVSQLPYCSNTSNKYSLHQPSS